MIQVWRGVILVFVVAGLLDQSPCVDARRNGSNVDPACSDMGPFHGVTQQTSPPPYKVSFNGESYTPGTPVTVTISACGSRKFKGFMIQARRAVIGSDQGSGLGSFVAVANSQQTCSGVGLIHTMNTEKTSLNFDWKPMAVSEGHVQFWVTFVETKTTFWAKVKSDVLRDGSISTAPDPSTLTPKTTVSSECSVGTPSVDEVTVPSGCGSTKGCIANKCSGSSCETVISWEESGNSVLYTITSEVSSPTSYVAIGFSSDKTMGQDSLTGCASAADGTVRLFNAETTGQLPPTLFEDNGVTLKEYSIKNNILSCKFERLKAASADGKRFDVTQKWIIIFATSDVQINGLTIQLNYHQQNKFFTLEKYSSGDKPDVNRGASTTQSPVVSGKVTLPSGCGSTKGCISKCDGSSCETAISWEQNGNVALYTISSVVSSSKSFVAIGFSSDQKMGGDSVTGCASASDGTVKVFNAENTGQKTPKQFDDPDVKLKDYSIKDNVLSCTIERPIVASTNGKRFDTSKKWIILFAKSTADADGQTIMINYHSENKFFTSSKYSSNDTTNVSAEDLDYPLIKAHGSVMIAAWIFFASIGIIAARYYKPVWKDDLCSQKVWFQIHRTCMVLVFCLTVAGFVIIFLEVKDWSDLIEKEKYLEYHPIMGVIVTALTVLNPLMALFRPHPGTKNRPIFNWAHWFVGTAAHILGVITIFFGVQLQKAQAPDYMVYILAGYAGWQVLVALTLELMQCCGREKARQELYEMNDLQDRKTVKMEETAKTSSTKRAILLVHVFVVTALSAIIIGFVVIGEEDL